MKKTLLAMTLMAGLIFPSPNKPFVKPLTPLSNFIPEIESKYQRIFYTDKMKEMERKIDDVLHYVTDDFNKDTLQILVARLMMGEDEDSPNICKIADAYTALTRAKNNNNFLREEILSPWQYSCFNPGTDSNIFLKTPLKHNKKDFLINLKLAQGFLEGKYKNPMPGATSYYNPKKVKKTPKWVKSMTYLGKLGNHLYYKKK
ncbi:MAG: cell wall hydrolase [Nanoarchaeota archaeon]